MGLVALQHVRSSRTRARTLVPALAGGLLTTAPPGMSPLLNYCYCVSTFIISVLLSLLLCGPDIVMSPVNRDFILFFSSVFVSKCLSYLIAWITISRTMLNSDITVSLIEMLIVLLYYLLCGYTLH